MSRNHPSPRSPTAPSSGVPDSRRLGSAFEAMFLDASDVAGGHFDDDWGVADTEQTLALSFVDDARLKACIVAASASVWGVPTMRPAQLEACYHLLHPHRPNSLVAVHRTGGGKSCQHARGESYLAMGGLDLGNIICTPCGNSCSICTRRLHEMFLPVYQSSVVLFLEFLMQSGQLQQEIDPKLPVSAIKRFGRRHCSIGRQVAFTECTWTHCSYR